MEHPIIINSRGKTFVRDDLKNRLISKYLSTAAGRTALAKSMIQPIRTGLDYQGIARKAFQVSPLPAGALSIYDKDVDAVDSAAPKDEPIGFKHDSIVVNSRGRTGRRNIVGRVVIPSFEIYSSPTVRIGDIKRRRFDLIDRSVQKARQQIMAQEDSIIFEALDKLGDTNGSSND